MEHTLINHDFERAVRQMRRVLPLLSFGLLIGTYLISALIMGIFHAQDAESIGFKIAAFLVPLAIQAGRGTLVFFFQLNPARIQSKFSFGIIAATALLILSLCEAVLVMLPYGLSWTISVSTLMLIGWVIEIMILRETTFATQMELYQNQAQWQELRNFYIARNEFERFVKGLPVGETVRELPEKQEVGLTERENESRELGFQEQELNGADLGKAFRPL
ncbi:MAG: hypothetical protein KIS77_03890 [Saprospiraceae bacterium]|nr:hypothetical protein [Saprospiraceae bacterium]